MTHNLTLALEALRQGKLILVTDDKDRENEGDLICAAEFATPENLNFMATEGRGLICMPMEAALAKKLHLHPMVSQNTDPHATAFTVSIDHVSNSTGISAYDRSATAMNAVKEGAQPEDFRRPGHMFPLIAREGGVLVRPGHTEATVDLCRLAGLSPCGLCCEIMGDDGTMLKGEALDAYAKTHHLIHISIAELKDHLRAAASRVEEIAVAQMPTKHGLFRAHGFVDRLTGEHHVALVKGDVKGEEPVLCRLHSECLTGDTFGSLRCDCGEQFARAMDAVEEKGRGLVLYLRQEGRGIGLMNKLRAYVLQEQGMDTLDANLALGFPADGRDYAVAAAILRHLGIESLHLMTNNPDKVEQITRYGIDVATRVPLEVHPTCHDHAYLQTKKKRMGHTLFLVDDPEKGQPA